jgi:hypothetical protein
MNCSELIVGLAAHFQQLTTSDAELSIKAIGDWRVPSLLTRNVWGKT